MALLTLQISVATLAFRQIRVVVKTVIKAVFSGGMLLGLHGAKKEKNADSAVKSNETLWFCKKGMFDEVAEKKKIPGKHIPRIQIGGAQDWTRTSMPCGAAT